MAAYISKYEGAEIDAHLDNVDVLFGKVTDNVINNIINNDTAANLATANAIPKLGEPVFEKDTGILKVGDGTTAYNSLPVANKQFPNIITVAKTGKADFVCSKYDNDATCIQAAIDYCSVKNIKVLWIFDGVYIIGTQLTVSDDISIHGFGNVTLVSNSLNNDMVVFSGSEVKTVTGSDVSVGATSITVSDATEINVGDLILIYDNIIWDDGSTYPNLKTGELHEVLSISGNTINFIDGLLHDYTAINGLSVKIIHPIKISIDNVTFVGTSDTTSGGLIRVSYAKNSNITNCVLDKGGIRGLHIENSYFVSISNTKISNCNRDGYGYGIAIIDACAYINIYDSKLDNCRHCVAVGGHAILGQSRDVKIYDNVMFGNGNSHVIDAHGCVESIYVHDNIIHANSEPAFKSGAKIAKFFNNIVYNGIAVGVRDTTKDMVVIVDGNTFFSCNYGLNTGGITGTIKHLAFTNNILINGISYLVYSHIANYVDIQNNFTNETTLYYGIRVVSATNGKIQNNTIQNTYRSGLYLESCSNLLITDNKIENSNLRGTDGTMYEAGLALFDCSNIKIINNEIIDTLYNQRFAIKEYNTSDGNYIEGNYVSGSTKKNIGVLGSNTIVRNNWGYITENNGTVTVITGETSKVVAHGLAVEPNYIFLTPRTDPGGYFWISAKDSMNFTVTLNSAQPTGVTFYWRATL